MTTDSEDDRRIEFISEQARLAHEAEIARYRRDFATMKVNMKLWSGTVGVVLIGVFGLAGWILFGESAESYPMCPNQVELLQDRPNKFNMIFKNVGLVMVHDKERRIIDCVWARESELESVLNSRHAGNK